MSCWSRNTLEKQGEDSGLFRLSPNAQKRGQRLFYRGAAAQTGASGAGGLSSSCVIQ